ncbi:MAG: YajQ family cyclic di-GMP-binding protein [Coxiella sp. RIFCSPHIGHO2_12_FULL_42_15]|nr:MAG: YajQ family cyclic di-GMP-binding protein [Coxiella sp. RIFCSPHIGHO2_12_FULL_42_15]
MPSFDIVCEIDQHEVTNAVDQANREVGNRFDFKGTDANYELLKDAIKLTAQTEFQLQQMMDILRTKLSKRNIDLGHIKEEKPIIQHKTAEQTLTLQQGISAEIAKKIVKIIKDQKMKVQASIQGDQVRVTGKKRDDLQEVMALLREQKVGLPLQFGNFRD